LNPTSDLLIGFGYLLYNLEWFGLARMHFYFNPSYIFIWFRNWFYLQRIHYYSPIHL